MACRYGISESSSEDNLTVTTTAHVGRHPRGRGEHQRKTSGKMNLHKDKRAEMLSINVSAECAEPICWCDDRSLSTAMKVLQLGHTRNMLVKLNIKLSIYLLLLSLKYYYPEVRTA